MFALVVVLAFGGAAVLLALAPDAPTVLLIAGRAGLLRCSPLLRRGGRVDLAVDTRRFTESGRPPRAHRLLARPIVGARDSDECERNDDPEDQGRDHDDHGDRPSEKPTAQLCILEASGASPRSGERNQFRRAGLGSAGARHEPLGQGDVRRRCAVVGVQLRQDVGDVDAYRAVL